MRRWSSQLSCLEWSKTLACHADDISVPINSETIGKTRVQNSFQEFPELNENPGRRTILVFSAHVIVDCMLSYTVVPKARMLAKNLSKDTGKLQ